LPHAFNNWYNIADEVGLMIHDEWRYFHDSDPQGNDLKEAEIELTRWVKQNLNHPSIVVWDNENEGDVVLPTLLPELRKLDPTRPWGEEDFDALHVYDYSENVTDSIVDQLRPQ
jgi:beta-galactosidase/beta-glucuronidase